MNSGYLLRAGLMAFLALALPSAAQEADESRYISSVTSAVDGLIAQYSKLPQHPVLFSANLILASGVGVRGVPTKDLLAYVDGLKAAGARRIQFNPGVTSSDNPAVMEKYLSLIHI